MLVQRMVDAEYAGVLFTRDPAAGGLAMVEMVEGTAENLVSGDGASADLPLRPRHQEAVRQRQRADRSRAAARAGRPRRSSCSAARRTSNGPIATGSFYLVQSRDITRPVAGDADTVAMQNDFARAIDLAKGAHADEIVFAKNELSEMLPRPTPLSLSLMEALWASGGSVDLAARELGLTYRVEDGSSYLTTILGRLYVDKREEQVARAGHRPAGGAPAAAHGRPHRARFPRRLPAAVPRARRGC